jgi:SSS family solute:Na+ symporter
MFTHDIVDHYIKHDRLGDRAKVISGRIFIVVIVALTWLWAQAQPGSVFDLGVWCFSGFAALFPLIFAALYWKRATRAGACACVLAAAGTWLYFFIRADFGAGSSGHEDTLPVVIMISASTAALIIVSLLTRPPSRATIDKFFSP